MRHAREFCESLSAVLLYSQNVRDSISGAWGLLASLEKDMMHTSTKKFWKMQKDGAGGILRVFNMIHGFIYYTLYDHYVAAAMALVRVLKRAAPESFVTRSAVSYLSDRYHAKTLSFENARKLVLLDIPLRMPTDEAKKIVPFEIANKLIFDHRDHIALVDCPCRVENRSRGIDYCEPINTCMFFGPTSVDFVTAHMPRMHPRRIDVETALELLESQRARGVSFNLWFKDATGYRGGVLCCCCSCCCAGAEADRFMFGIRGLKGRRMVAPSGFSPSRDDSACASCGMCITVCPYGALTIDQVNDGGKVALDSDRCRGCGACESVCPNNVVTMVRDKNKGEVLDIDRLRDTYG